MPVKKWFYMLADGRCERTEAVYPGEVNAARDLVVLVADVPLKRVGMKEVDKVSGYTREELSHKARKVYPLKLGATCRVDVGDHREFGGLVYQGRKRLSSYFSGGQDTYYSFSADEGTVLIFAGYARFVEIDGRKIADI